MSLAHEINASSALFFFCRASWSNDETAHGCQGWSPPILPMQLSCTPCSVPCSRFVGISDEPMGRQREWISGVSSFSHSFRLRRHLALLLVLPARHDLRVERITGRQLNPLFLPTSSPSRESGVAARAALRSPLHTRCMERWQSPFLSSILQVHASLSE